MADIQSRLDEIQKKEARIRALEKELDEFESAVKSDSKGVKLEKNWPCKQWAIARHDISLDIPIQFQKATRKFYSLWILTCFCTIANWLCIIIWASNKQYEATFQDYFFATLYVVIGCPLSWMLLYKRFYKAMINNGDIGSVFFLFLFLHMIWTAMMAIGFTLMDAAGWLVMTKVFVDQHNGLGFMMLISAMLWTINCFAALYLMRVAQYTYGVYLGNKHAKYAENFT